MIFASDCIVVIVRIRWRRVDWVEDMCSSSFFFFFLTFDLVIGFWMMSLYDKRRISHAYIDR